MGYGSTGSPWKTLSKFNSTAAVGDTCILKSGTYTDALALKSSPTTWTTYQAETDGGAILTGGVNLGATNYHARIVGLAFRDSGQKNLAGTSYVKFLRCDFQGGAASGTGAGTTIGTNDNASTAYILLEDCFFCGARGRYNLLFYNARYCVARRCVIRHDGGYGPDSGNPEAGVNLYDSEQIHLQNCIVLDSTLTTYVYWEAAFYMTDNDTSTYHTTNCSMKGCIALNNREVGFRHDGSGNQSALTLQDCVAWDHTRAGWGAKWNGSVAVTLNRLTVGSSKITPNLDPYAAYEHGCSGSKPTTNVIAYRYPNGPDFEGTYTLSYFDSNGCGSTSTGTGRVTYSPLTNGLLYLPRIEAGSALKTAGTSGGQIGAQILTRIGVSESLYGDTDWNTDTGLALWPWPYEDRIKTEMAAVSGGARGFCTGTSIDGNPQTLTKYIWEYLGNQIPADVYGGGSPPTGTPVLSVR